MLRKKYELQVKEMPNQWNILILLVPCNLKIQTNDDDVKFKNKNVETI